MKNFLSLLFISILCLSCSNDDSDNDNQNLVNDVDVTVTKDDGEVIQFKLNNAILDKHCSDVIGYFVLNVSTISDSGDVFDFYLNVDFYDQEIEGFDTSFPQTYNFNSS